VVEKEIPKTEEGWKKKLTGEQYDVLRGKATEAPFIGKYLNEKKTGMYSCVACGNSLFSSDTKFESDTGWPSFSQAVPGAVKYVPDHTLGMERTEVTCARCGSHLGHMFNDGPTETGKRYCLNSVCLDLQEGKV